MKCISSDFWSEMRGKFSFLRSFICARWSKYGINPRNKVKFPLTYGKGEKEGKISRVSLWRLNLCRSISVDVTRSESCKYIIQICHRQSFPGIFVAYGRVPRRFLPTFPLLSFSAPRHPRPCIIAVNSLTYLRTASLTFARYDPVCLRRYYFIFR